jgi:hypothetical protein
MFAAATGKAWMRQRDGRMGLLRGYGNAIVPPLAAEFVTAFLESLR